MAMVCVIAGIVPTMAGAQEPAPPAPPVAAFAYEPSRPDSGVVVTFTSTSTAGAGVGNPIVKTEWDLDDDGAFDDASGLKVQHVFATPGSHRVRLRVEGALGGVGMVARIIDVANRPPQARFVFAFGGGFAIVGNPVTFISSSSDAEGPVSENWDLDDDGAFDDAVGPIATATFRTPGERVVRLRVTDAHRATSVATALVPVGASALTGPAVPAVTGSSVLDELLSPFPIVRVVGSVSRRGVTLGLLTIRGPESASYTLRCSGPGCPFRKLGPRRIGPSARRGRARSASAASAGACCGPAPWSGSSSTIR